VSTLFVTCSGLHDNSPTNQLAVSQVADWITRRQQFFKNMELLLENWRLSDRYRISTETGCIVSNSIGFCYIGENRILRASLQIRQLLNRSHYTGDQRTFVPRHPARVHAISSTIQERVGGVGGGRL